MQVQTKKELLRTDRRIGKRARETARESEELGMLARKVEKMNINIEFDGMCMYVELIIGHPKKKRQSKEKSGNIRFSIIVGQQGAAEEKGFLYTKVELETRDAKDSTIVEREISHKRQTNKQRKWEQGATTKQVMKHKTRSREKRREGGHERE